MRWRTEIQNSLRYRERIVIGENKERWLELCEQAAHEQDSDKLIALAQEIICSVQKKKPD
ncbi:MAG: hypothetical protein H0X25_17445 [Acidobacteriales bacterium]|nr:hypothetical protein [Terriglobales bacterium]